MRIKTRDSKVKLRDAAARLARSEMTATGPEDKSVAPFASSLFEQILRLFWTLDEEKQLSLDEAIYQKIFSFLKIEIKCKCLDRPEAEKSRFLAFIIEQLSQAISCVDKAKASAVALELLAFIFRSSSEKEFEFIFGSKSCVNFDFGKYIKAREALEVCQLEAFLKVLQIFIQTRKEPQNLSLASMEDFAFDCLSHASLCVVDAAVCCLTGDTAAKFVSKCFSMPSYSHLEAALKILVAESLRFMDKDKIFLIEAIEFFSQKCNFECFDKTICNLIVAFFSKLHRQIPHIFDEVPRPKIARQDQQQSFDILLYWTPQAEKKDSIEIFLGEQKTLTFENLHLIECHFNVLKDSKKVKRLLLDTFVAKAPADYGKKLRIKPLLIQMELDDDEINELPITAFSLDIIHDKFPLKVVDFFMNTFVQNFENLDDSETFLEFLLSGKVLLTCKQLSALAADFQKLFFDDECEKDAYVSAALLRCAFWLMISIDKNMNLNSADTFLLLLCQHSIDDSIVKVQLLRILTENVSLFERATVSSTSWILSFVNDADCEVRCAVANFINDLLEQFPRYAQNDDILRTVGLLIEDDMRIVREATLRLVEKFPDYFICLIPNSDIILFKERCVPEHLFHETLEIFMEEIIRNPQQIHLSTQTPDCY